MYGFVNVNVYSDNAVPRVVELMVSLKVVATESLVFLILAVMLPDGVPVFFKRTFQDFKDFPTNKDEAAASSPYLMDVVGLNGPVVLPGIGTL